jgi:biotin carboxylase
MKADEYWLIAVTAGRWQRHGIRQARDAGLKVLAIDADPQAEGFSDADLALNMDLDDPDMIIRCIINLGINVKGVVSFVSEVGMMLAAQIREAFNLPGPDLELTGRLIDKSLQRQIWSKQNIPGPDWKIFDDQATALAEILRFGFPLVVKPVDASGSRGVSKLESAEDDLELLVANAFKYSKIGKIIVESYMEGTEFTVEVFADQGQIQVLAVTEKKKVDGTRGTVASELATSERKETVIASLAQVVIEAFQVLGYTDGPGHAEIILKNDGHAGMVELAGRGGGFMLFERFVPLVSGVNIARLTALQAVGEPLQPITVVPRAAVLRFIPSKPGVLRAIKGLELANQIEGVDAVALVNAGDMLKCATTDSDRLAYILTSAKTARQAQQLADQAESLIDFEIEVASDY